MKATYPNACMPLAVRAGFACLAAFACLAGPVAGQERVSGGDGTIFVGTYAQAILVVSEATFEVIDTIPFGAGVPVNMFLSQDRNRLYVLDAGYEHVEVFDVATRAPVDRFTLSEGNRRVRISGFNVDPQQRFAVLLAKTYTKLIDRFEIGPPKLLRYDLTKHVVTDTIAWPGGQERDNARILFSPDGESLYFFTTDDILVYETATLKQVDRFDLAHALEQGMGRFNFGFPADVYEEPGFYTGLFRVTDPVQNRSLMGVARVNLERRSVDFYTLGPNEPVSFALAPDHRRAYGLRREIGNYEFWTFDLENRRVAGRTRFDGRPRMGLTPSSNGRYLYIHTAGSTIDVYDVQTFRLVRTVDLGADMIRFLLLPPRAAGGP
jgi:DNA-binding beta-propeller fold protein YncE